MRVNVQIGYCITASLDKRRPKPRGRVGGLTDSLDFGDDWHGRSASR